MGFLFQKPRWIALLVFWAVLACLTPGEARDGGSPPVSLVPSEQWISDSETRLAMARFLSYDRVTLRESLRAYDRLLLEEPQRLDALRERVQVLIGLNLFDRAARDLDVLLARFPDDAAILEDAAVLAANAGHAVRSRALYEKALSQTQGGESPLALRYADRRQGWGDFYGAEKTFREWIRTHPGDNDVRLSLAGLLAASQRYEEAEGVYRKMLARDARSLEALRGMAAIRLAAMDFDRAGNWADQALQVDPSDLDALWIKADALFQARRDTDAWRLYEALEGHPQQAPRAWAQMGKIHLRQGKEKAAAKLFARARKAMPDDPHMAILAAGLKKAGSPAFLNDLKKQGLPADRLCQWGRAFGELGMKSASIHAYRAALARDADSFPARLGLAEALGADHQYGPAIEELHRLAKELPGTSKIELTLARVYAWSRAYDASLKHYEALHRSNPNDPVPLREMARTALWGKRHEAALRLYGIPLDVPVDERLSGQIKEEKVALVLREGAGSGRPYDGYEALQRARTDESRDWTVAEKGDLDELLLDHLALYRIQKSFDLERRAKDLVWHHRYSQALPVYESLLHFTPGNLEARFDQAQLYCTLGLCGYEASAYRALLDRDPFHNLAALALSKQRIRSSPALEFSSWYWREDGRGDLSRIQRLRHSLSLEVPFFCQYRLKLTGHQWNERPDWSGQSYLAEGYSLEGAGVFNTLLRGEAGYTHRKYRDGRFMDRDTGYGRISLRLRDDLIVGGGYERTNEIYNEFSIRQGVQGDVWSLFALSYPTRYVDLRGEARHVRYSDDNQGQFVSIAAGYAFTDHPRIFKAILSGEYRHSEQENRYLYDGTGRLIDIVHPYWTPKNYTALGLTLEWRHDLSKLFFCGNDLHFYDIRTSIGTDSESNPYLKVEGEWYYEFRMHWTVGLVGMIHRSRDWRGESLYATIRYRF